MPDPLLNNGEIKIVPLLKRTSDISLDLYDIVTQEGRHKHCGIPMMVVLENLVRYIMVVNEAGSATIAVILVDY